MSNTIPSASTATTAENRKQAVKSIATRIVVAVGITVVAHVISNVICEKIDEKMLPEKDAAINA